MKEPAPRAPLRVVFSGARGRMGRVLVPRLATTPGLSLVGEVEKGDDLTGVARAMRADVVIDFTEPSAAVPNARAILAAGAQGVIGTTGFEDADLDALDEEAHAAKRGLLVAPNFSIGMVLLQRFAELAAERFPDVEIVETHHPGKRDAPSGTAIATARRLARVGGRSLSGASEASRGLDVDGVRVHSLRLPGVVARQEVFFGGLGERLRLEHDVEGRECFLPGVVLAVRRMPGRVGLLRGLDALLDLPRAAPGPAGKPG